MYSNRPLAIPIAAFLVLASCGAGRADAQAPGQGAADTAPTDTAQQESPAADVAGQHAVVTWDEDIQRVVAKAYPQSVEDLRIVQQQVRQVVSAGRQALVGVEVEGAVGSAVVVSQDGLVLTAGHVAMAPGKDVRFYFADGRTAKGVTLGVNRGVDSGMMRITDKGPWPHVPMAPAGGVKEGTWVVGLGQPNGFMADRAPPVRLGRVLFLDDTTLCTDVTLVGGDSGGPLLNLRGQVVGIHSRIGRRVVSNYHVPIDQYHQTWDRLASGEIWGGRFGAEEPSRYRTWLGVAGDPSAERCVLTQVYPGMPADRAGLRIGDVITRFGEQDVESFAQLAELVQSHPGGARVDVRVERDGRAITKEVRLGVVELGFPGARDSDED